MTEGRPLPGSLPPDLASCEREQIHLSGAIQPHGALLLVREPDHVVVQASANAAALLGLPAGVAGLRLRDLGGDLATAILPHLLAPLDGMPVAVAVRAGTRAEPFDALLHRPAAADGGAGLVVELEPALPAPDIARAIERGLQAFLSSYALPPLCDAAARVFAEVTGYDRAMIYRFDAEGHGEVLAESARDQAESYLGNHYPASDIPQVARRLYERNRVRLIADAGYAPVPIEPRVNPLTGTETDLSFAALRSVSPVHRVYLRNMGVAATLVFSVLVGGRLWGLVACHHATPHRVPHAVRAAGDLLAEALGTRIAALESFVRAQAELSVRRLEQRIVEAITRHGDWRAALFDNPATLLQPLGATGAALLFEGAVQTAGEVPGTAALRALGAWLDRQPREAVHATHALAAAAPEVEGLLPVAAGLLAAPISAMPGEYLVWFRPEQRRVVTWGGDPTKPAEWDPGLANIAPRRSFARWQQVVEGTSEPWSAADLAAARMIGSNVSDVAVQVRAVRMLLAEDQLAQIRRQVGLSAQPVVICDAQGSIRMANEAFDRLIPALRGARPQRIEQLLPFFDDPGGLRRRLTELLAQRRSWSGEVRLADTGIGRALLMRADPVLTAPDRAVGFVFLFDDLTERKAAEAARRRFQAGIADSHRMRAPSPGAADPAWRGILGSVLENAQLAALEIAEGVEVGRMPEMLESVRASVGRMTELLDSLARQPGGPDPEG